MPNLSEVIQIVNAELEQTESNYYHQKFNFLSGKVDCLKQLKTMLEKKAQDNTVDLNLPVETKESNFVFHTIETKSHTLLNIAAMYCKAEVVAYLLENGAKPDNSTIHHAARGYNRDMDKIIETLKNHDVNLNSLNKKGETALYKAVRKREDIRAKDAVVSLKKHGASMLWSEKMKAPLLNKKDAFEEKRDKVLLAIFAPGLRGC